MTEIPSGGMQQQLPARALAQASMTGRPTAGIVFWPTQQVKNKYHR